MVDRLWHLIRFRYELVGKQFGGRNGQSPNLRVGGKPTNSSVFALVVEQADTTDLGSVVARRAGSSPVKGTDVAEGVYLCENNVYPTLT